MKKEKGVIDKLTGLSRVSLELRVLLVDVIVVISVYIILPFILNMPQYSMNLNFQMDVLGFNFIEACVFVYLTLIILQFILIVPLYKRIDGYVNRYLKNKLVRTEENARQYDAYILKIRNDCLNVPYKFYGLLAGMSLIITLLIFMFVFVFAKDIFLGLDTYTIFSIVVTVLSIWFLLNLSVLSLMISYNTKILRSTYRDDEPCYQRVGKHTSMKNMLVIQLMPIILAILILYADFVYVNTVQVKSRSFVSYYKMSLDYLVYDAENMNSEEILKELDKVKFLQDGDAAFVIDPFDNYIDTKGETKVENFLIKYRNYFFYADNNDRAFVNLDDDENVLFEGYGIDLHYYTRMIVDNHGRNWYVGYKFNSADTKSGTNFLIAIFGMFTLFTGLVYVWASAQSKNEQDIANSMEAILNLDDFSKAKYIPILSRDETGDIAYFYNRIQERMTRQQDILLKQEQLSILGEMAGGMAHDINTPISAINTAITMLSRKHSDDERDKQILDNMQVSTDRIISIVTSMRNQVRNMGSSQKESFSLKTMVNDINIITANEQKKSGCTLEFDIADDIVIYGERTKLGQVLTNLIVNGLQASVENERKGPVAIRASRTRNDRCIIEIEDHAGGIPKKVQPYIFNNIMTTKGVKGTGLGLYLASTVIKGIYEGTINFETREGDGTTFIINIPMNSDQIPKEQSNNQGQNYNFNNSNNSDNNSNNN